jgi:hypothetical protein
MMNIIKTACQTLKENFLICAHEILYGVVLCLKYKK